MLETYDAVIQPNGQIGFREQNPPIFIEPTDVYVTVRRATSAIAKPSFGSIRAESVQGNGARLLQWIKDNPMPAHMQKTKAEIDAQILEMRNSWD